MSPPDGPIRSSSSPTSRGSRSHVHVVTWDSWTAYHDQLAALTGQLAQMCARSGVAMERATQALLQADLVLAEQVITDHTRSPQ